MVDPIEDRQCYASETQREILMALLSEVMIAESFFLTGGTALSVFYLHHRRSEDIDLFTLSLLSLNEISLWVKRTWADGVAVIKETPQFLSCLIKGVRVDLVIDPLSSNEKRPVVHLETDVGLQVDTIANIASNKLCAAASRMEPKDLVDLYFVFKTCERMGLEELYRLARKKEVMFDDPPTVAYQMEEAVNFLKGKPELFPRTLIELNKDEFFRFFKEITKDIYAMVHLG